MSRTGRATKLTPELQRAVVTAVSIGTPLVVAAAYAGIDKATVLEWIARGEGRHRRAATARYADFADAIRRAQAQDEVRRITRLEKAARGGEMVYEKVTTHRGLCSNGTDMRCSTYPFICGVQEYAQCIYAEPKQAVPSAPNTPHI